MDRENSNHPDSCEYTLIGGESHKLARCPSSLMGSTSPKQYSLLPEKCPRCQLRKKRVAVGSGEEEPQGSRPSSSSSNGAILRWDEEDVMAWLRESGWEMYEVKRIVVSTIPPPLTPVTRSRSWLNQNWDGQNLHL